MSTDAKPSGIFYLITASNARRVYICFLAFVWWISGVTVIPSLLIAGTLGVIARLRYGKQEPIFKPAELFMYGWLLISDVFLWVLYDSSKHPYQELLVPFRDASGGMLFVSLFFGGIINTALFAIWAAHTVPARTPPEYYAELKRIARKYNDPKSLDSFTDETTRDMQAAERVPVTGYKAGRLLYLPDEWKVVFQGVRDTYGVTAEARCSRYGHAHVPHKNCTCGFYSLKRLGDLIASEGLATRWTFGETKAFFECDYWGHIVEAQKGYRAQFQRILRVTYPRYCSHFDNCSADDLVLVATGESDELGWEIKPVCQNHLEAEYPIGTPYWTPADLAAIAGTEIGWQNLSSI